MALIQHQGAQARSLRTLRKWIAEEKLAPGEPLPTEHALVELLKVSRTTVRNALSQLESEGLIRTGENRRRTVCRPESSAGQPPSAAAKLPLMANTVGLFPVPSSVPEALEKRRVRPVWERYIQAGVVEGLQQEGKDTLSLLLSGDSSQRLQALREDRPLGLVALYDGIRSSPAWPAIEALAKDGVPLVIYGFKKEFPGCDTLASDHAAGCAALTRFLLKRGRRRLLRVWAMETPHLPVQGWIAERDRGFEDAMREAGQAALPALRVPINLREKLSEETFIERRRVLAGFLLEFVKGPARVDALLAASDSVYFPLAAACRHLGLKPGEDIDIVGYDNNWHESVYRQWEPSVPLATVDKHNLGLGHELAALVLARASQQLPARKQHRLIAPELILGPA